MLGVRTYVLKLKDIYQKAGSVYLPAPIARYQATSKTCCYYDPSLGIISKHPVGLIEEELLDLSNHFLSYFDVMVELEKMPETESGITQLIEKVEQWSEDKGLNTAESSKQMLKVIEEVGEVAGALARNDKYELRDGIGDVFVTLIILAQQNDLTVTECLTQAYNEIANRKGKMINGVFVKESDLV